jgi:hypothetical protein
MKKGTATTAAPDLVTATHVVTRISGDPRFGRVFINALGRSLEFEDPTDPTSANPGTPQGIPAVVAEAIQADASLADHLEVRPIGSKARATNKAKAAKRRAKAAPAPVDASVVEAAAATDAAVAARADGEAEPTEAPDSVPEAPRRRLGKHKR